MNKTELINEVAKAGLGNREAANAVEAVIATMTNKLIEGDKIVLSDFGTFVVKEQAEHRIIHPGTGEPMVIPPQKTVMFKIGKEFKERLNRI